MSLPLELKLKSTDDGPRLAIQPVNELESLRGTPATIEPGNNKPGDQPLRTIGGDLLEVLATVRLKRFVVDWLKSI